MLAGLAPELKVLAINLVACAVAYLGIYPSFRPITWTKVFAGDVFVSLLAITVSGILFYGTGTGFWLFGVTVNWAVFAIITLFTIEIPFVTWFAATQHIEGGDED